MAVPGRGRFDLAANWNIQSSVRAPQGGDQISTAGFDSRDWFAASVPSTVIGALVTDGLLPDPYYSENLRSIPGTTYPFGDNFAVDPMPADSPYAVSWWYRTEFTVPRTMRGGPLWLNFDSINYRANIWLNGRRIAAADQIAGMYRGFEFEISGMVAPGMNALAVEVFAPAANDLSLSFVDWNPLPADKDMGLVRDVYILSSGPVALRHTQVAADLNDALDQARLTLYADLTNAGSVAIAGTLRGTIGGITVAKTVQLAAGESARIAITPEDDVQLVLKNPLLWWPNDLGPQNLYQLHMEFRVGGTVSGQEEKVESRAAGVISDQEDVQFGIRKITSELDSQQHRLFRVNGKRILIRGAAWTHDMMLRVDPEREEEEIRYAAGAHLNAIRLEGKMFDDHLYDLTDRYGILVMAGWCCCSGFEEWDQWTPDEYTVAAESLRYQARQLRNHPSVLVFLYGSDNAPPPGVEQIYMNVLVEENWPNPFLNSAGDHTTPGSGRSGVKMTGPYDWVAPSYWLLDVKRGGAWGFITETCPGPAIPLMASLQQMMPADDLWPIDNEVWNFHAGSGSFADTRNFTNSLNNRYGAATGLADYVKKSQVMTYEAERAMFEAYGRNKYTSTGVIQWLLNNSWPGLIWHLFDWYLRPGGGYFGTLKGNEPLHVQYSYDDGSIVVVNSLYSGFPGYSVTATVYNLDLTVKYAQSVAVDIPEDSSTRVFYLPAIDGLSRTYFVRLQLRDGNGNIVSSNFYWLSTQPDVFDWAANDYPYAQLSTYADLTGLQSLPAADVTATWTSEQTDPDQVEHVVVRNPSSQLAFFVHLTMLKGRGGADIAPVWWSDNYFELLPGEERQITATYPRKLLGGVQSYVQVDGWNVAGR